jgi:hypothetical protein
VTGTWMGRGGCGLCVCACMFFFAANAFSAPVDPNNGYIWIGDSIGSNLAQGLIVFDKSEGAIGSLIPVNGAPGAGWIQTTSGNYPDSYTFGLQFTVPLAADLSMGGTANGWFGGGTYSYALKDLENGGAVLLSGQIIGSFGLVEGFNNVLFSYGGSGGNEGLELTVTGGSLRPYFAPKAEMFIQYWIASPANLQNFSTDLICGGGASVAIYGVPEPATFLVLLSGGVMAGLLRRREGPRISPR